jgi:hypothetical protein
MEVTSRKCALKQGNRIGVRFINYDKQGVFLKCAEILPTRLLILYINICFIVIYGTSIVTYQFTTRDGKTPINYRVVDPTIIFS